MAMALERDEEGKHCPVCGKWFYRKADFCSDDCFFSFQSKKKVCPICKDEFYPNRHFRIYCSDICKAKKNHLYLAEKNIKKEKARGEVLRLLKMVLQKKQDMKIAKPKKQEMVCSVCGDNFTPERSTRKYCCPACASKAYRKRNRKLYARICPFCGKEFETPYIKKVYCNNCLQKAKKHNKNKVLQLMKPFRKKCPICGIHFYSKTKIYCSTKCENIDL